MKPILDGSMLSTSILPILFIMSCAWALFIICMGTLLRTAAHCDKLVLGGRLLPRLTAVFLSMVARVLAEAFANAASTFNFEAGSSWFKLC